MCRISARRRGESKADSRLKRIFTFHSLVRSLRLPVGYCLSENESCYDHVLPEMSRLRRQRLISGRTWSCDTIAPRIASIATGSISSGRRGTAIGSSAGSPKSAGGTGDAGSGAGATSRRPPAQSRTDPYFSILAGTSLTLPAPAGSYSLKGQAGIPCVSRAKRRFWGIRPAIYMATSRAASTSSSPKARACVRVGCVRVGCVRVGVARNGKA